MKTAIEELNNEIQTAENIPQYVKDGINALVKVKYLTKEKQQIIDAWNSASGGDSFYEGEDYYNETFKTEL
jgi:hypothetical protein